jgi:hypothetical protein
MTRLKTIVAAFWLTAGVSGFARPPDNEYSEPSEEFQWSMADFAADELEDFEPDQVRYFVSKYSTGNNDQTEYAYIGIKTGLVLVKAYTHIAKEARLPSRDLFASLDSMALVACSHLYAYQSVWNNAKKQCLEHKRASTDFSSALEVVHFEHLRLGVYQALNQARTALRTEVRGLNLRHCPKAFKLYSIVSQMASLAEHPRATSYETLCDVGERLVGEFESIKASHRA